MKKTLKSWLLLLLVVCMFPVVQISTQAATPLLNDREISILYSLEFYPEVAKNTQYITRADYVKMMGKLMKMEDMDMNLALSMGLINSFDDGEAGETKTVTFGEAIRGLVTALGYDKEIAVKKQPSSAFNTVASQLKITSKLNFTNNSPLTQMAFAVMIYRTLEAPVLVQVSFGDEERFEQKRDVTLLSYVHNIYHEKGQITDNGFSSFMGKSSVGTRCVKIGNMKLMKGNVGEEFLFGYHTEYYYRKDDTENVLLWIWADSEKNDEIYLTAQELMGYENGVYTYEKDGRKKTIKMPKSAVVLYNGKAESMTDLTEEQILPKVGEITFLDADGNGSHEVVIIMDYMVDTVSYVDAKNRKLYFNNEGLYPITEDAVVRISNGRYKNMDISDIKPDNTLWCASSTDGKYISVLVNDITVSGTIETIDYEENLLIISGEEYAINRKCFDNIKDKLEIGAEGTFYLDIEDAVADFEKVNNDYKFAYLIRAKIEEPFGSKLELQVFDGKIRVLNIIGSVKVNGASYTSYNKVLELLGGETVTPQIICYKADAENCISDMQYVEDYTPTSDGGQKLHVAGVSPKRGEGQALLYKHSGWLFTNYFALQDNAPVFILPTDRYDLEKYALGTPSSIGNDNHRYGVTGFKLDESSDACVAATYDDNLEVSVDKAPGSTSPCVIKNVTRAMMEDGQPGTRINFYNTNGQLGYKMISDEELEFEELKNAKPGDIVRLDTNGEIIIDFSVDYNYITDTGRTELLSKDYSDAPRVSWGTVYRRNQHTVLLDSPAKAGGRGYIDYELVQLDRASRIAIVELVNGKPSVRIGSEQEVQAGDKLYYTCSYGFIREVVVIKEGES